MRRTRELALPLKRDAFTAIVAFMTKQNVELNADEQRILDRWIYCDALLRAKEKTDDEIAEEIKTKYLVSIYTATNDITQTKKLFAKSREVNKKYTMHLHLMRIDQDLERLRKKLFLRVVDVDTKEESNPVLDPKDIMALAKLNDSYTYALNSLPEESTAEKQPPPIFQFILAPGQIINKPMELKDALAKADEIIMKEKGGIYVAE